MFRGVKFANVPQRSTKDWTNILRSDEELFVGRAKATSAQDFDSCNLPEERRAPNTLKTSLVKALNMSQG